MRQNNVQAAFFWWQIFRVVRVMGANFRSADYIGRPIASEAPHRLSIRKGATGECLNDALPYTLLRTAAKCESARIWQRITRKTR